jgi:NhaP-type Na+/H+ or K+/H+ antiporter
MPFSSFSSEETTVSVWRLVVIGILVLLLRRLPVMLLLYKWIPDVRTFREAVFSGHFGPSKSLCKICYKELTLVSVGVGAIFIATLALEKLPKPNSPPQDQVDVLTLSIEPIIAFVVMCSILIRTWVD